ncbi:MAG: 50S ribosomal protein L13 [Clostridia bacterium]|nr:50S ribosomal protein L13 [Clostridia bacterium]
MSTFMQKPAEVVRKWYVLDAAGKPLGKTAVAAADLLRGKNDPTFTPNVDCGNFVIIINAEKATLSGNKMTDKYYYHHSGYIGGMKKVQYKTLMEKKPEFAMELAVKGMLPDTTPGRKAFTRLKVYAGDAHKHEAQKPETYEF